MAPEVLVAEKIGYRGEAADMFAVGVILFVMVAGRPPFKTSDPTLDPHYNLLFERQFGQFWYVWES